MSAAPQTVRLADYQPPRYRVDDIHLRFDLRADHTEVHSAMECRRDPATAVDEPLRLDGEELALREVTLDGEVLDPSRYTLTEDALIIEDLPQRFRLGITNRIQPEDNTRLEGLYRSGGIYCTQCEAEGFRRITFFPDRPDVMARYRVTIEADRVTCPVLLSNGNPVASGELDGDRHWAEWYDPFPKPSYLFALVAGDLHCHEDGFETASGRNIRLAIYTEHANAGRTAHAMDSLKAAMRWDEVRYGLECDLDNYMVVAVGDFNMGAMENKGLNVFNTQYVLARPDTATDADYAGIEAVIAHEYFHNWTGNRVTLRDWFQLSLKEGLTVFREHQFCAEMGSAAIQRINEVRTLRAAQFPEDAGPMAHPVRPAEFVEINNFYTATVYMKGAEVIRMYHTLLGDEAFRRGIALYFRRHDGQAVTCEDFLAAMADAGGRDLGRFARWYNQPGTPRVRASGEWDRDRNEYRLNLSQETAPKPGHPAPQPQHIPVATALIGPDGRDMRATLDGAGPSAEQHVLELSESRQTFVFSGVDQPPVPSLLRGFSAPVTLDYVYSDEELAFLVANDADPFNRWEAGQRIASRILLRWVEEGTGGLPARFHEAFDRTLHDDADPALIAETLSLPGEGYLGELMEVIDPEGIHLARQHLRLELARTLGDAMMPVYERSAVPGPYRPAKADMGRRRLRNVLLDYLAAPLDEGALAICLSQFDAADNMTEALPALALLTEFDADPASERLEAFIDRWRDEPLVVDKWFRIQALSRHPQTLQRVRALTGHPAFDERNPNRLRSLIGAFCQGNPAHFHHASGQGYTFLADHVMELDQANPQVAARLLLPLTRWRRHEQGRARLMRTQLERIAGRERLSNDVHEVVSRSLDEGDQPG